MPKTQLLDEYEFRARMVPGLWVVIPVAVALIALGLKQNPVVAFILGSLSAVGGPVLLSNYVRQRGRVAEKRLFREWGGEPTTIMLRHRGNQTGAVARANLRARVSECSSVSLPSERDEIRDPSASDAVYREAVAVLRAKTRDKDEFPLVSVENANYGYERNLLGMRPVGIGVAVSSLAILVIGSVLLGLKDLSSLTGAVIGGFTIAGVLVFWWRVPRPESVRRIADTYAERLFEAALA